MAGVAGSSQLSRAVRLLEVLSRPTLLRIATAYRCRMLSGYASKGRLITWLSKQPEVDAYEIVEHMLTDVEARKACRRLDLRTSGRKADRIKRLKRAIRWRPFGEARAFARSLGLSGNRAWRAWCRSGKRPATIPATPEGVYRGKGWKGWGDWLGTGNKAPSQAVFRSFREARAYVRRLGLRGHGDWMAWCSGKLRGKPPRPGDIPTNPQRVYRTQGWRGVGDWLGTGTIATQRRSYRAFKAARRYVRRLKLKSQAQWRAWIRGELKGKPRKPSDLPANPHRVYAEWTTWGDWLGTGCVSPRFAARSFLPFREARAFARSLGLRGSVEWEEWCAGRLGKKERRPAGIPTNPQRSYRDSGWRGWGDWLDTGNLAPSKHVFWPFAKARRFARRLGLATQKEWFAWRKGELEGYPPRPPELPTNPERTYADEWRGYADWLGTAGRRRSRRRATA